MTKTNWTADQIPSQSNRRVVITGANSGIGFCAALQLARRGAEIVLLARTDAKAADAVDRIQKEVPDAKVIPAILDLASLQSVRAFAAFYGDRFPGESLDLLINNAGVMAVPAREITTDGYERQFATNYLGPFALTALLLPHLKPITGSRIVTVASTAANFGKINFDDLQSEKRYRPMWGAYAQSKLADLIFAQELQRRLTAASSPHHQHRRSSGICNHQPAKQWPGQLWAVGSAYCNGSAQAHRFAGCRAWRAANAACRHIARCVSRRLLRPQWFLRT